MLQLYNFQTSADKDTDSPDSRQTPVRARPVNPEKRDKCRPPTSDNCQTLTVKIWVEKCNCLYFLHLNTSNNLPKRPAYSLSTFSSTYTKIIRKFLSRVTRELPYLHIFITVGLCSWLVVSDISDCSIIYFRPLWSEHLIACFISVKSSFKFMYHRVQSDYEY